MADTPRTIIYTQTDEAPALATASLLPIISTFAGAAGVEVELRDISLAARVLAQFSDRLPEDRRVSDDLAELGQLVTEPDANVIKLPNISASIPQLKATIEELQAKGYAIPDYPDEASTPEDTDVRARYGKALPCQPKSQSSTGVLTEYAEALQAGAFVVVSPGRIRVAGRPRT